MNQPKRGRLNKHDGADKIDSHIVPCDTFCHDGSWKISRELRNFHNTTAYAYYGDEGGFTMGIQNRQWRASGHGFYVDGCNVGKNDING